MPQGEWRSEAAYDDKRALDASGFAFEYLRRNPKFIRHVGQLERSLAHGALTREARNAFARRWGMRFREARTRREESDDPVDDGSSSEHHPTGACPCRI